GQARERQAGRGQARERQAARRGQVAVAPGAARARTCSRARGQLWYPGGSVDDSRIGTILDDRYQILERIGAGGMGVVYRGERTKLGRGVAIKFLHAWMAADPTFLQRFQNE